MFLKMFGITAKLSLSKSLKFLQGIIIVLTVVCVCVYMCLFQQVTVLNTAPHTSYFYKKYVGYIHFIFFFCKNLKKKTREFSYSLTCALLIFSVTLTFL